MSVGASLLPVRGGGPSLPVPHTFLRCGAGSDGAAFVNSGFGAAHVTDLVIPPSPAGARPECQASCTPPLPAAVASSSDVCVAAVRAAAAILNKEALFFS